MNKPKHKALSLDELVLDADTQARVRTNEFTVDEYAATLQEAIEGDGRWPFPKLDVFHDGTRYLMSSGFTRTLAAIRAKWPHKIPCRVFSGGAKEAREYGMGANNQNGERLTQEDRRANVEWLMNNARYSQSRVADVAGVSVRTVRRIKQEREQKAADAGKQVVSHDTGTDTQRTMSAEETNTQGAVRPERLSQTAGWMGVIQEQGEAERVRLQRSKTVKTIEALMRAFDDLNRLEANGYHQDVIDDCRRLLKIAREWSE